MEKLIQRKFLTEQSRWGEIPLGKIDASYSKQIWCAFPYHSTLASHMTSVLSIKCGHNLPCFGYWSLISHQGQVTGDFATAQSDCASLSTRLALSGREENGKWAESGLPFHRKSPCGSCLRPEAGGEQPEGDRGAARSRSAKWASCCGVLPELYSWDCGRLRPTDVSPTRHLSSFQFLAQRKCSLQGMLHHRNLLQDY